MARLIIILTLFISSCGSKNSWTCVGDCENGEGTRMWADGRIQKGTWANGKLNGQGMHFYGTTSDFSGDTYEGEFKEGIFHGYGTYYDKSEGGKYMVYWANGKQNGKGKAMWGDKSDNRYYDGEWKDGLMHGYGTKSWGNVKKYANHKYVGYWKNDEHDGFGKYEWPDGSYYEGPWKNGEQHGEGTYVFADGEVFKGMWVNGYCKELAKKLGLE